MERGEKVAREFGATGDTVRNDRRWGGNGHEQNKGRRKQQVTKQSYKKGASYEHPHKGGASYARAGNRGAPGYRSSLVK